MCVTVHAARTVDKRAFRMDFNFSEQSLALQSQLETFFQAHIIPRWREWQALVKREDVLEPDFVGDLRALARREGLWNLAIPDLADEDPGTRLSNLEYAPLAEYMGRFHGSALVFNCQPPDVPNVIALQHDANTEQRERWLRPLLEGEMRSAFAMTEYAAASSDATNIATRMRRDGDDYVIDGHKWYITGAAHPNCAFFIVMAQTDPDAPRAARHSTILHFCRALPDGDHIGNITQPFAFETRTLRPAQTALSSKILHQLLLQRTTGLNEETAVNGFVGHLIALVTWVCML